MFNGIGKSDFVVVAGDLNARLHEHLSLRNNPKTEVIGNQGEPTQNENGKLFKEFLSNNRLKITNTFLRKRTYIYTWSLEGNGQSLTMQWLIKYWVQI